MPVHWGPLKQSGVAATVRQRAAEHPNRAVRAAVAAVTQRWAVATGDASLATAPPQGAVAPQAAAPAHVPPARRELETPSPSEEAAEVLDAGVRQRLAEAEAVCRPETQLAGRDCALMLACTQDAAYMFAPACTQGMCYMYGYAQARM